LATDKGRRPATGSGLRRAAASLKCSPFVARALSAVPTDGAMVLRYHSVNDAPGWAGDYIQRSLTVAPAVFDRQMCFLKERFTVVGIDEIAERIEAGSRVDRRMAAVTFDDGYEDNYRNALPILRKHGLTAAFYVTSGAVGDADVLWTVRLRLAVRRCSLDALSIQAVGGRPLDVSSDEAKESAIKLLTGIVKRSRPAEADAVLAQVIEACGAEHARPDRRVIMDEREIREMRGAGMTVGAHTVNHYNLTCLEPDDVAREIRESRAFLEDVVGESVVHMAYPDGRTGRHFDGGVARAAKEQGLRSAVTSIAGPASSAYSVFSIPRLGVVPSHSRLERLAYDMQYSRLWGPRDDVFDEVRAATDIDGV